MFIFFSILLYIMELNQYDVIIVGSGLSGIVMAEQFASILNKRVLY